MTPIPAARQPSSAADIRQANTWLFEFGANCAILCRHVKLTDLLLKGRIPAPILAQFDGFTKSPDTFVDIAKHGNQEQCDAVIFAARTYAALAAVSPRIVMPTADGQAPEDPTVLVAGADVADSVLIRLMDEGMARRIELDPNVGIFRADVSGAAAPAGSDGPAVLDTAERVRDGDAAAVAG